MEAMPLPPFLAVDEEPIPDRDLVRLAEIEQAGADVLDAPESIQRWSIENDEQAEWAMRKHVEAVVEIARLGEQANEWQRRIAQWFDQASARWVTQRQFFAGHLERYAVERRLADPKCKTIKLPSGEIKTRETSEKVDVVDEDAVIAWAKDAAPEAVKTTEKVLVGELRKVVSPTWKTYATLNCPGEHMLEGFFVTDVGTLEVCPVCSDPNEHDAENPAPRFAVVALSQERVVTDAADNEVPGVEVVDGGISPTVVPYVD